MYGYYGVYHGLLGLEREITCMMDHRHHDLLPVQNLRVKSSTCNMDMVSITITITINDKLQYMISKQYYTLMGHFVGSKDPFFLG